MSLNSTPTANRLHIGIFGKRNAGKSSVINALTGQSLSVVSDVAGTTTDPVYKSMELLPLGPVTLIDTPGLDDSGKLGELRIEKSYQVLNKTDLAVLVADARFGLTADDRKILKAIKSKGIPYITVYNKSDIADGQSYEAGDKNAIYISCKTGANVDNLKKLLGTLVSDKNDKPLVKDLVSPLDVVILVIPIDEAAPKGRLILPQQQVIRELLEAGAAAVCVKETELESALASFNKKPKLVITDSQAFNAVSKIVPDNIPLTSFSILFARFKGDLRTLAEGACTVDTLTDGDFVLISEGCTHHRQCGDIGTVKLPKWILSRTGEKINFEFTSGGEFPRDLSKYKLIVHCGGCMLNEREMRHRIACAAEQNVKITNYGTLIAYLNGILKRSVKVFPDIYNIL